MDGKGDAEEDSNVIRLPRDWVGPLEELVPIGPAARARERERLAREAAENGAAGEGPIDTPVAASDFWTEGASAVHHAIAGPPPTPEHAGVDHRPRGIRRRPVPVRRLTQRLRAPRLRRPLALPSARSRHLVAAVTLAAVLVVAAVGLGEGPRHPSRLATAGVTYHPLNPVDDRATAGRHAPVSDAPRTDRHVTRIRRIRHPTRRHTPPRAHHALSAGSPHPTVVVTPAASPEPVEPTTPAASVPIATSASNHPGSSSAGSSRSSSSGHSSSGGGAGPSGFGSASGCDPKCS